MQAQCGAAGYRRKAFTLLWSWNYTRELNAQDANNLGIMFLKISAKG